MKYQLACAVVVTLTIVPRAADAQRLIDSQGVITEYAKKGNTLNDKQQIFDVKADAFDSKDPAGGKADTKEGDYTSFPRNTGSLETGKVTSNGIVWSASALTKINFVPVRDNADKISGHAWDSKGSKANLTQIGNPKNAMETAYALSRVTDPRRMQVEAGESSEIFGITFAAGTHLAVQDGVDGFSRSSIFGNQDCDLLTKYLGPESGSLFNFRWSLDSLTPGQTQFVFSSNPALGFNDGLIRQMFLANVVGSMGDYSLASDLTIEFEIGGLSAGRVYEFGGELDYEVEAATDVPGPWSLFTLAPLLGLQSRRTRGASGFASRTSGST